MCGYKKTLEKNYHRIDKIKSQIFSSKLGDIEYILVGEGPIILISHGISGGIDQGNQLVNSYFSSSYRFLLLSRFGYLKSSIPENSSVELQAEAYKLLLDHLGIKKVIIFPICGIDFFEDLNDRSKRRSNPPRRFILNLIHLY